MAGARLVAMTLRRTGDGAPGYRLDTPFGEAVQVLPRPPAFRATIVLDWDGAVPEAVEDWLRQARALGLTVDPTG